MQNKVLQDAIQKLENRISDLEKRSTGSTTYRNRHDDNGFGHTLKTFFSRIFRKPNVVIGITLSFLLSTIVLIFAAAITRPFTFTTGSRISASQMNSNFYVVYNKVNQLDSSIGLPVGSIIAWHKSLTGTPRTADETRPVNMSVVWIMKIK